MSQQCRVGASMYEDYAEHSLYCPDCSAYEASIAPTVRTAQDVTWAGAVTYVRDMAQMIRGLTKRFVADSVMAELATVRAEALEECADGMERAAHKARTRAPVDIVAPER